MCCLQCFATCACALVGKAKQPRARGNLTHTVVLVSDDNQKNAQMDSEIFIGPIFRRISVLCDIFSNPTTYLPVLGRIIEPLILVKIKDISKNFKNPSGLKLLGRKRRHARRIDVP